MCDLDRLTNDFLFWTPTSQLPWPVDLAHRQADVLEVTLLHDQCRRFPVCSSYARSFLRAFAGKVDACGEDLCDEYYQLYAQYCTTPADAEAVGYRSYSLPNGDFVVLEETLHLVADGTTGLRTWPAAIRLANWVAGNRDLFYGKSVLELGSGSGLLGMAVCKLCDVRQYTFTDCHDAVLRQLRANIAMNLGDAQVLPSSAHDGTEYAGAHLSPPMPSQQQARPVPGASDESRRATRRVCVRSAPWECIADMSAAASVTAGGAANEEEEEEDILAADIVLASDVVYDIRCTAPLVAALRAVLQHVPAASGKEQQQHRLHSHDVCDSKANGERLALVASTVRNAETYGTFLRMLEEGGMTVLEIGSDPQPRSSLATVDDDAAVRIIQIKS